MVKISDTKAAPLRLAFTLNDSGAIVWRDRASRYFEDEFSWPPDKARDAAKDWNATKAGKSPRWEMTPRGPAARLAGQSVLFWYIVAALDADPDKAKQGANLARADQDAKDAKNAVLRLCRIDHKSGQIVWRKRTPDNAPKTPQERRNAFNSTWAGKPLPIRGGTLKIQRKTVQEADARQWLQDAASKEAQDPAKS